MCLQTLALLKVSQGVRFYDIVAYHATASHQQPVILSSKKQATYNGCFPICELASDLQDTDLDGDPLLACASNGTVQLSHGHLVEQSKLIVRDMSTFMMQMSCETFRYT